jgi:hypothetical protein
MEESYDPGIVGVVKIVGGVGVKGFFLLLFGCFIVLGWYCDKGDLFRLFFVSFFACFFMWYQI